MSDHEVNYGNVEHFYKTQYASFIGRKSTGILSKLWKYPHKKLERNHDNESMAILELGAGEGEHFHFVQSNFSKYIMTDIDFDRLNIFAKSNSDPRVDMIFANAESLPFEDNLFDRVISTCLLVHLKEPEYALDEWRRVTRNGGILDIYIPCEPGLALRVFRRLLTEPSAKSRGFHGYRLFIARDHVTSAHRVLELLKYVFRDDDVKVTYHPFVFSSWYLNLFITVRIRVIK
jgi:ubiquinone/menaquinone biosynthesis C-methylase UbiE